MVGMDSNMIKNGEFFIDLESGFARSSDEAFGSHRLKRLPNAESSSFDGLSKSERAYENWKSLVDERGDGEETANLVDKKDGDDRLSKKTRRKSLKPPRPPKSSSLGSADHRLVREISELAAMKRTRIERMRALKNRKNRKATSSNSNIWAFLITVLFCAIIIWQGMLPKGSTREEFHGSPESSLERSVRFQRNISRGPLHSRTHTGVRLSRS